MHTAGDRRITCERKLGRSRACFGPLLLVQEAEAIALLTVSSRVFLGVGDSRRDDAWVLS